MKLLGFFQYAYLVFAILFLYDAYTQWSTGNGTRALMSLLLAALAVFIFFFRKRYRKKFEDKNNQ
ncbi:MAG: hypothetical protein HKO81_10665 [Flavobacteriaceae bacterium]|nr:hypothetical protein [Bacteroidia bacterium]NNL17089.1 hypothetical protein [Flavobacteriaceae bacterium]